jgi:multidrug efflux pump subunit AcrA (membrane-fusion protein)
MKSFLQSIRNFVSTKKYLLKKKRFWLVLVVVFLVIFFIVQPKGIDPKSVITDTVKRQKLEETVLATGQVTSTTDLALSFNSTGVVRSIKVKVGDKIKAGTILATLDQASAYATLQQARGGLLAAQARLRKLQEGATNEEIRVAELTLQSAVTDLENIKNQQDTLVANARRAYLNSALSAVGSPSNPSISTTAPTISGVYTNTKETRSCTTNHSLFRHTATVFLLSMVTWPAYHLSARRNRRRSRS